MSALRRSATRASSVGCALTGVAAAAFLPGLAETPCANSGRSWLFRLGLYELTCGKEAADDWVWLVDHTVQLGVHKGLIVVGLRLSVWQRAPRPLQHADVRLLHLEPMEHSDGKRVQSELEKVVSRTGVPRAIVSDVRSDAMTIMMIAMRLGTM